MQVIHGSGYGFGLPFHEPSAIASDGTDVWVADYHRDAVTELNATTGIPVRVLSGSHDGFSQPKAISSDGADVWVANPGNESVTGFPA